MPMPPADADLPPPTPTGAAAPGSFRPRHAVAGLRRAALCLSVVFLLAAGGAYAMLCTDSGMRLAWRVAVSIAGGKLSGTPASGNLADGLVLRDLHYRDAERDLRLDRFAGAWHWSLAPARLTIDYLQLGQLGVTLQPTAPKPLRAPRQITLPLAVDVKALAVQHLVLHRPGGDLHVTDVKAHARSDRLRHGLQLDHAGTPYGALHGALRLDGTAPFAIEGRIGLATDFERQRYALDATLSGSLHALGVAVRAGGGRLSGSADITATPFDPVLLRQVRLALQHLDPRVFNAAAPQADLTLQATLVPLVQDGMPPQQLVVGGPISLSNAAPGALDQGRLPLLAARADVRLDQQLQRLDRIEATLPGTGRLSGNGALHNGGQGEFNLQATALDLQQMHGALIATRLAGPIALKLHPGAQDLMLHLRSPGLSISADAHADAGRLLLQSARLQAGEAVLDASAALTRDARAGFVVKGAFKDVDPAAILAQVRTQAPAISVDTGKSGATIGQRKPCTTAPHGVASGPARINMDFDVEGALQPELALRIGFAIHDSSYDRLPLTGAGTLQVQGKRLLASDARISIAGNDAAIKGSFGMPSDRLALHLDAPALARLGFGLAGQMRADAHLAGSITQPVIDATWQASDVVAGANRLAALTGEAHIDGMPGRHPDARLALTLEGRGIQAGPAALAHVTAQIDGSVGRHSIDLRADGRLQGQPLALTVAAQGELMQAPTLTPSQTPALAWRGVVRTLDNRGVPRLAIGAPLTLRLAADRLELGATRLTLGPAEIDLKRVEYRPGVLRSEGAFAALRVADVLALQRRFTGSAQPLSGSLVLDGSWNLDLGAGGARGFAQVVRRSGDLVLATPLGASALGLGTLRLRADLQGERVQIDSRIDAGRIGTLAARGEIGLLRYGDADGLPTIGPDSSLSGNLQAAVPVLRNIAGLTGPSIALEGSVNLALTAAGTLGKPLLSGELDGDRLALTLFDQGVRLRDGTARIALHQDVIDLRDVTFRGGSGTLKASGRIPLDQGDRSDNRLGAMITADRLQLLNDPARQLILSGQARIANVAQQLDVNGHFTVERGLFSLPEKSAPALSDDVVIVHRGAGSRSASASAPATGTANPAPGLLPPRVNLVFDLGNDLRFKGGGADLFLAGALTIRSGPTREPQAFGTVRVVSGVYEAFGARLDIERGLLTFQGPFDNPSINLLAMRRNQTVPAGVQVNGNVQQPRVTLVSEPNLGEDQKLSWLVFGRGDTDSGSSSGNGSGSGASGSAAQAKGAVQSAALGLVNKFGGSRLAENVGLDKLSIGASEYGTGSGQVVNLGKEISKRLFIGYEQGLAGAESAVKLTYELTQHWSLILRGGAVAGLDVNYSRRFDRLQAR